MDKRTSNIDSSNDSYRKHTYKEHQEPYSQDITDVKPIKVSQANQATAKFNEISRDGGENVVEKVVGVTSINADNNTEKKEFHIGSSIPREITNLQQPRFIKPNSKPDKKEELIRDCEDIYDTNRPQKVQELKSDPINNDTSMTVTTTYIHQSL